MLSSVSLVARKSSLTGVFGVALVACATAGACSNTDVVEPPRSPPESKGLVVPAEPKLRRLLARHYRRSIAQLLGENAAANAAPPADTQLNGFASIASSQLSFNDSLVQAYDSSARKVAASAVLEPSRIEALAECAPGTSGIQPCLRAFVERFGRLAFRRPLEEAERDALVKVGQAAVAAKGTFLAGVELVITAVLQSPSFLYQVEVGTPHPTRTDVRNLTGYEVATRLAFLLAGRSPDRALLDAAAAGELDDEAGVRAWGEKLMAAPESAAALRDFFGELFVLEDLDTQARDPNLFPEFSPELARSMREEVFRIVEDVIARDAPLSEVLTTSRTFLDGPLASLYGAEPPSKAWEMTSLPEEQGRSGILTSAAVMTKQAHTTTTSATYRGLFVMERLLCTTMPPPPQGVITTLPPSSQAPTLRDRLAVHLEEPTCRACHYMSDNLGLTFENFDAIGRFRTEENGAPIDASGEVDSLGSWTGPRELAVALAASEVVQSCLLRQLHRYANGHVEVDGEWPALNALDTRWTGQGQRFRSLLVDFVSSDLFRRVGALP